MKKDVYVYQSDLVCGDCCAEILNGIDNTDPEAKRLSEQGLIDSDHYPQGPHLNLTMESDRPEHCGDCGEFLFNQLTDEGQRYVASLLQPYLREGDEELGAGLLAEEVVHRLLADENLDKKIRDNYIHYAEYYDWVLVESAEKHLKKSGLSL